MEQQPSNASPGRVLVCDDDAGLRQLMGAALSEAGLDVDTAEDGREALARASASAPDAIVADWLMPGLDGISLCSIARGDPSLALAHIVLVTGRREPEYARLAADAGADEVLMKPFEPAQLVDAVCAGIRRTRAARQVVACTRTDPATGLRDERCLAEDLDRLLWIARDRDIAITVAALQAEPGHDHRAYGPDVAAAALSAVLGPADALYRVASLGEAGFCVVAPDADEPELLAAALETAARGAGRLRVAAVAVTDARACEVLDALRARLAERSA